MGKRIHHFEWHRSTVPGIEMVTKVTHRPFPRHWHDQFAMGVIGSGAQRSCSGLGTVYCSAGDVITENPGEIHDGIPLDGKPSTWRMIYLATHVLYRAIEEEITGEVE